MEKRIHTSQPEGGALLVNAATLASILNVGLASIWRLQREGMPMVRVGRITRYSPQTVLAWLHERSTPAPADELLSPTPTKARQPQRHTGRSLPVKNRRIIVAVVPK